MCASILFAGASPLRAEAELGSALDSVLSMESSAERWERAQSIFVK